MSNTELDSRRNSELQHIAFIPDGNRRWARKRGAVSTLVGHRRGFDNVKQLCVSLIKYNVKYATFFFFFF